MRVSSKPDEHNPTTRSASDTRMLTAIKVVLSLLLVGYLIVGDNDRTWPLVTWPMFQGSGRTAPRSISSLHIHAVAADGTLYDLTPGSLSTTLSGSALDRIVTKTFDDDLRASEQRESQARLAAMVSAKLPGVDIAEIQAWKLNWPVQTSPEPGIVYDSPAEQNLLGKFRLADIEAAS